MIRARLFAYLTAAVLGTFATIIWLAGNESTVLLADAAPAPGPTPGRPIPVNTETNCVRCHLTAGRELTEAVHTFAHSVHDRVADVTCHDCHGGNLNDDAKAHSGEFGFIGTKMSAHLAKCQECHQDQHEALASGPHAWDQQKRLNIRYPLCVDCHGNHDVGNPPAEFSLTLVCTECHRGFKSKEPLWSSLTDAEDNMWAAILQWQSKNPDAKTRVPADMEESMAQIRQSASEFIHRSTPPSKADLEALVGRMKDFATEINAKKTARAD